MPLTKHAQKRLQQRGIPAHLIDILLDFGHTKKSHLGREVVYLNKLDRKLAASDMGCRDAVHQHGNTYIVLGHGCDVVTAGHRHRRIKNH